MHSSRDSKRLFCICYQIFFIFDCFESWWHFSTTLYSHFKKRFLGFLSWLDHHLVFKTCCKCSLMHFGWIETNCLLQAPVNFPAWKCKFVIKRCLLRRKLKKNLLIFLHYVYKVDMQETPFLVRQTNMEKEGKVFFISSESETLLIARKIAHVFEKLSRLHSFPP